ncbi:hypothetical protein WJX77_008935 [Trebouxia sp. C0004]
MRRASVQGDVPELKNVRQALGSSRQRGCNPTLQPTTGGPDISLLRPDLQRQWNHAKNIFLGDRQITPCSNLRVWWNCDQCPCGLPHEWLAAVNGRQTMDHQCPFCTNKRLCQHNSLLTVAPGVAAYWDRAKNKLSAEQVAKPQQASKLDTEQAPCNVGV